MRIVVIGGTGFIGFHLVRLLFQRGHSILVLHRGRQEALLPSAIPHLHGSLTELAGAPGLDCDAAIHMYAMGENDASEFVRVFQPRAARLLVASSGDVYQAWGVLRRSEGIAPDSPPLLEDAPLRTHLFPYPEYPHYDKIPVERIVLAAGSGSCVLRLPAVYGPGDSHHRFGAWLRRMESPRLLIGPEEARWRFTHGYVENVAEAIAIAVIDPRSRGRIYNAGELHTPAVSQRIASIGQAAGWTGEIVTQPDQELPHNSKSSLDFRQHLVMDTTRIRQELGFTETVSVEEAIQRTIAWELDSGHIRIMKNLQS